MNNNRPILNSNSNLPPPSSSSTSSPRLKKSLPLHKMNGRDSNSHHTFCTSQSSAVQGQEVLNNTNSTCSSSSEPSCNTCQQQQRSSNGANCTAPSSRSKQPATGGTTNANNELSPQIPTPDLSTTEEEDCADSDDQYCVYTYKGDGSSSGSQQPSCRLAADLPSSFFKFHPSDSSSCPPSSSSSEIPSLDMPSTSNSSSSRGCSHSSSNSTSATLQNGPVLCSGEASSGNNPNNNNAMYSPDMDFLEMDFDPGGSGDGYGCCDGDDEEENEDNAARDHLYLGGTVGGNFSISRRQQLLHSNNNITGNSSVPPSSRGNSSGPVCGNNNTLVLNNDDCSAAVVLSKLVVTRPNAGFGIGGSCNVTIPPVATETSGSAENDMDMSSGQRINEPVAHCSKRSYNFTTENNISSPANKNPLLSSSRGGNDEIKLRLVKSVTLPEFGSGSSKGLGLVTGQGSNNTNLNSNSSNSRAMAMSISAPVFQDKLGPEGPCPQVIPAGSGSSSEDTMELEVDGVMIWTVPEAQEVSISQIGRSSCGATACLNVLSALGCIMTTLSPEFVNNCVGTRLRAEDADLPEYLISRSSAGTTHEDLISGIHRASNGLIYGRFFHIKPNTPPGTLNKWLLHWICKGAVPIATLNLQVRRPGELSSEIPDAWHHQMIFGVTRQGIFLTNPLECVPTAELIPQLSSPSVLLIRRDDITKRRGPRTDLRKLVRFPDPRWNEMNVLGQVSNMLLEEMPVLNGSAGLARRTRTAHVSIPAAYTAGITLFIRESNSSSCALLKDAPEF